MGGLDDVNGRAGAAPISAAHVISAVCQHYKILPAQIWARNRRAEIVMPRHVAMALAVEMTGAGVTALASVFDRDHSTVLHAVRRVRALADDPAMARRLAVLRVAIRLRAMREAEDAAATRESACERQIVDRLGSGGDLDRARSLAGVLARRRAHEPRGRVFRAARSGREVMQ
ncbi:MAG: hypothetical protein MRY63_02515 [Neomegalonema sp.]|nr:hypothetical protein [Neomegalonema sp.]